MASIIHQSRGVLVTVMCRHGWPTLFANFWEDGVFAARRETWLLAIKSDWVRSGEMVRDTRGAAFGVRAVRARFHQPQ